MISSSDDVPISVKGVFIAETKGGSVPIVLLEDDEEKIMPIYIGPAEAVSIHMALRSEVPSRPLTHDLFVSLLNNIEYEIQKIIIDELKGNIYYAKMILENDKRCFELDARPSDCIAIAIRTGIPIFVKSEVFNQSTVAIEELGELRMMDDLT
ncbi:Bifunctional nuclease [Candidatus Methanoperedenaceae archaeon GB50]|nr:Bifunctional nuclease [Candidatus Methanoperedenaceae archaeon GB50]CAD7774526.1 MAG: Bifunctional nuclease [Candidatus Methanoperedenaceae archaeon GB50]